MFLEKAKNELYDYAQELKDELRNNNDVERKVNQFEERVNQLVSQIERMSDIDIPQSTLEYYVKTGGHIWISQDVYLESEHSDIEIGFPGMKFCSTRNLGPGAEQLKLPRGIYKLVLMAIPQKTSFEPREQGQDGYGRMYKIDDKTATTKRNTSC